jgi:5-deoxy-glucuronate isomerase
MSVATTPVLEKMVFRKTHGHVGRRISVTPGNSASKHLCYGRIVLNAEMPSVRFSGGNQETGLICLSGQGTVKAGEETYTLCRYDSIYVPRDTAITVSTSSNVDFAEFSCDVADRYPLRFVPYAELEADSSLKFSTGKPGSARHLNICLGKNVEAGRLLAGFTVSEPGNWTSWPPHEHAKMLEEIYVYIEMPSPGFGIQLVYNNTEYPELVVPVREGDAVMLPSGYHPNVAIPGHPIAFLWAMAAHREKVDRQYGVVNIQPEFSQQGSGLEASRK